MMRFEIKTLVDVTETGSRRHSDLIPAKQQANLDTLINLIGLRSNPSDFKVRSEKTKLDKLEFGSKFKGSNSVWFISFTIEADESLNVDMLINDFNLVPIFIDLDETVKFDKALFITNDDNQTNILFERIE